MNEMSLFDLLPEEEAAQYKPKKSTDWKWTFADYPKEKNGLKVFSCFACGGGSTMGYKLAGCEVLGCCEIDPKMNEVYVKNHNPKYNFLMDIRAFNALPNDQIPEELFHLDMSFNYEPVTYGEIKEGRGRPVNRDTQTYRILCQATTEDLRIADVFRRIGEKERCFNNKIAWDDKILQTLTANLEYNRGVEKERITELDIVHAQTFPEDYDFLDDSWNTVAYICGMSVPPIMIKRIVQRLIESGVL